MAPSDPVQKPYFDSRPREAGHGAPGARVRETIDTIDGSRTRAPACNLSRGTIPPSSLASASNPQVHPAPRGVSRRTRRERTTSASLSRVKGLLDRKSPVGPQTPFTLATLPPRPPHKSSCREDESSRIARESSPRCDEKEERRSTTNDPRVCFSKRGAIALGRLRVHFRFSRYNAPSTMEPVSYTHLTLPTICSV